MCLIYNAFQKPNIWSKKNTGVLERAQNDLEQKTEDADIMDRARHAADLLTEFQNFWRHLFVVFTQVCIWWVVGGLTSCTKWLMSKKWWGSTVFDGCSMFSDCNSLHYHPRAELPLISDPKRSRASSISWHMDFHDTPRNLCILRNFLLVTRVVNSREIYFPRGK